MRATVSDGKKGHILVYCNLIGRVLRGRALFRIFEFSIGQPKAVGIPALFVGRHSGVRFNLACVRARQRARRHKAIAIYDD